MEGRLTKVGEIITATFDDSLNFDGLLDAFILLYNECSSKELQKDKNIANFVKQYKPIISEIQKLMLSKHDFEDLKVIGRGAFGEVHLVKGKFNGQLYAMKILNKWEMLRRQEVAMFKEERKILLNADPDWLTSIHYCFQDEKYLYLLMEYYPGGDLLSLESKFEEVFTEEMARFYTAELIMAIECIHKLDFVHRDVKPDNVLIDRDGHIKLTDFGSCVAIDENGEVESAVSVGTPDYISPETLQAVEGKGKYGKESDWWSLGVMLYEMLVGETPFYSESLTGTYAAIMDYKNLQFPEDVPLSDDVKDLIRGLLNERTKRYGKDVEKLKNHPWFQGINWNNLREMEPPYVPELKDLLDTSHFEDISLDDIPDVLSTPEPKKILAFSGHHLPFIGFSFSREMPVTLKTDMGGTDSNATKKITALEKEVEKLRAEKRKISQSSNSGPSFDQVQFEREKDTLQHERDTLQKQVDTLKNNLKDKDRRVNELEILKSTTERNIEDLKNRLEQERAQFFETSNNRKKVESDLRLQEAKALQTESDISKLNSELQIKEKEIRSLQEKLNEETKQKNEFDKAQKSLKLQLLEVKEDFEKEQSLRKKAELSRDELLNQSNASQKIQGGDGKSELDQLLKNKDKMIKNLKEALEKECEENDEAIEILEIKILSDKKKYTSMIDELKVELEGLKSAKEGLERTNIEYKTKTTKLTEELSTVNDELFNVQTSKLQVEEKLSKSSAQILLLEKEVQEKDNSLQRFTKQANDLEGNESSLQQKIQELELNHMSSLQEIRQLESDLAIAKGRLENSSDNDEIVTLKSQVEADKEIRTMLEKTNQEINTEVSKLKKRLEEMVQQKEQLQKEKNELLSDVEPSKMELERERKLRKELDVVISKQVAEINSLTEELSQADESFDEAIAKLKDRYETAMKDMSTEIQELESNKKTLETSLWKVRGEKDSSEETISSLRKQLLEQSRKNENLEIKIEETSKYLQEMDTPEPTGGPINSDELALYKTKVREFERRLTGANESLKIAEKAAERAEERLRDKDSLLSSLQARLESQTDRINSESKRQKSLMSEIEILRTELDRETSKRKALDKEKKKFNSEIAKVMDELNKMTALKDQLAEDNASMHRQFTEIKEKIISMKEIHEHEVAALKIQQQSSVMDLSIRVKEVNEANNRLRRRTATVEQMLSMNAGSEDATKTIADLQYSLQQATIYIEQEKQNYQTLLQQLHSEQIKNSQGSKLKTKFEETISELDSRLESESKTNEKLMEEQRQLISEISTIKSKMAESNKLRSELETKFREKESDFVQLSYELNEVSSTKTALAEQLKSLREELENQNLIIMKLENSKKRLSKELDEARSQLMLSANDQLAAALKQLKEKGEELDTMEEKIGQEYAARNEQEVQRRKKLEDEVEELEAQLKDESISKNKINLEIFQKERQAQELKHALDSLKESEAYLNSQLEVERNSKLDLEIQVSSLRSENMEELRKLDSMHHVNLELMVEIEELKEKMHFDISQLEKIQKELKETLQEKMVIQEKLTNAQKSLQNNGSDYRPGLVSSNSISRKPSMRTNWQAARNDKKMVDDMRNLQQSLDVTIKAKMQLEKVNQELLVEKEALQLELEQFRSSLENPQNSKQRQSVILNKAVESKKKTDKKLSTGSLHSTEKKEKQESPLNPIKTQQQPQHQPPIEQGPRSNIHKFVTQTFTSPTKCQISHQIMFGTIRQGLQCEVCKYACLPVNEKKVPQNCSTYTPQPFTESISEGCAYISIPKPKGIRQGWKRVLAIEDSGQIFIFTAEADKNSTSVEFVIDARSEDFSVEEVNQEDVIHASKKDLESIFQVVVNENGDKRLLLAQTPEEKAQWMKFLKDLHQRVASQEVETIFEPGLCVNEALPQGITCIKRWRTPKGEEKYVLGGEEGIYISHKKNGFDKILQMESVVHIDIIQKFGLLIVLGGKVKHVRIWPICVLEKGPGWPIVLEITKNCQSYALGKLDDKVCICVATKKRLLFLQVDSTKRFSKMKELPLPELCSYLKFFKDKLCIGFNSRFQLLDLKQISEGYMLDLPSKSDPSFGWTSSLQQPLTPVNAFKLKTEYLLCFHSIGFFVDEAGKKPSKTFEFKWLSNPIHFAILKSRLLAFCSEYVEVYSLVNGKRLQIVSLHGISACEPHGNLVCANEKLMFLLGSEPDGDEIEEEVIYIEDEASFDFEKKAKRESKWTAADSDFLKKTIRGSEPEEEEEEEDDEEDEEEEKKDDDEDDDGEPIATDKIDFLLNW